jgi:aspartate/methionine/tyrosine aminotransferase
MEFPDFGLLHWFEGTAEGYLHISHSEILGFRFSEFGHEFPDLDLGVANPRGTPQLRSLIGAQHQAWPEQVLVCNGASEANFLAHAALLKPGDEAIVEVPQYPPLRDSPVGFGAVVKGVLRLAAEKWRLDLDALEATITARTRLVVLTNLNNPTDGALSAAELKRLADLAEAHKFHVHVDETFRELGIADPPPSATQFGPQFVVTSTLTKAFGLGGLRLGWVVAAPDVLARIKAIKDYASVCPSRVSEEIAMWALHRKKGFLARAKRICDANREVVRAWLARNPEVACVLPDHGNLCFPRPPLDADRLADLLKERYQVTIAPGRFFGMAEHFRLGYGGKREDLEKGLQRVDLAMQAMRRRKTAGRRRA